MTNTPRMNAAMIDSLHNYSGDVLRTGRQIELELSAANKRIKSLEEVGQALIRSAGCGCPYGESVYRCSSCVRAFEDWYKLMETK